MPILTRVPSVDEQPASWLLRVRANETDEETREALAGMLEPGGPMRVRMVLGPGSAVAALDFEMCETCPVMKWRPSPGGTIQVSLQRVAVKALTELWELTAQGAGDYYFEVLDLTADLQKPVPTHLTLRLEL